MGKSCLEDLGFHLPGPAVLHWLRASHFPVCGNFGWLGVKAGCGFPLEEFPVGMWEVAPEAKQEEQMGQQKEKRERELVCDSFTHGTAEKFWILGRG